MRWSFLQEGKPYNGFAAATKGSVMLWDRLVMFFLVLIVLISGYIIFGVISGPSSVLPDTDEQVAVRADQSDPISQPMPSFEEYASVFLSRDIFKTDEERLMQESAVPQVDSSTLLGWGGQYHLVGVIVDQDPRAIIQVMDPPAIQFLKIGDSLGEAVLTKVEENGAWFRYQEQQVQLKFSAPVGE